MNRLLARRLFVAAVLIGAGLVSFGRLTLNPTGILVGPQRGGLNDLTDYFLPQTEFKILAWRKYGSPPTWDPHLQLGRPIVGNPQAALYYPATWLMLVTGTSRLASWLLVAHHIFAGWGMYLLCRRYGCAWPAALVGGISFLAAPYFVAHTAEGHFTMTCAAAWIPWALLAYERLRRGRPYSVVMLAAVLAIAFFAGHAQTVYYLVLALCAFVIIDVVRGLMVGLADSAHPTKDSPPAKVLPPVALVTNFALAGMLTAGLVAIDFLPIWLTSQQTTRVQQRQSAAEAGKMGATAANLKQLVFPFALGTPSSAQAVGHNYWETLLYVGIAPLLLAIIGAAVTKFRYPGGRYTALFIIALLFSLGATTPLYTTIHNYLPGAATFRVPTRAMLFTSAAVSVLAAAGLNQLIAWCLRRSASPSSRNIVCASATVVMLAVCGELAWHASAITRTVDSHRLRTSSRLTQRLANSATDYRVLTSMILLSDEEAYRHGIDRVRGYDPFLLVRYAALLRASLSDREFLVGETSGHVTEANLQYNRAVLQMLGVKYAVVSWQAEQSPAGWALVHESRIELRVAPLPSQSTAPQYQFVYENARSLPRAFVIGHTVEGRDLSSIDPTTTLLVPPGAPAGSDEQPLAPATIVEYQPAHVVVEAELAAPGYVVLSDVHALGWKAKVNGQSAPIVPVNIGLRGVHLPAGKHRIEMNFSPPLWMPGLAISLLSLAIFVYLVVKDARREPEAVSGKAAA